jgi:large conductance mechanosensitive channel
MSILKEFKAFIIRGNVIDLAIALVIGVAFGKIISSFVNDIIMPPLSLLIGGVNLKDQKTELHYINSGKHLKLGHVPSECV